MSTLIPEIPLSEFKKLKASDIRQLKSCEIIADGEYLCTVVIPPENAGMTITDHTRTQAEYLAVSANTVGGKNIEQIREPEHAAV